MTCEKLNASSLTHSVSDAGIVTQVDEISGQWNRTFSDHDVEHLAQPEKKVRIIFPHCKLSGRCRINQDKRDEQAIRGRLRDPPRDYRPDFNNFPGEIQ